MRKLNHLQLYPSNGVFTKRSKKKKRIKIRLDVVLEHVERSYVTNFSRTRLSSGAYTRSRAPRCNPCIEIPNGSFRVGTGSLAFKFRHSIIRCLSRLSREGFPWGNKETFCKHILWLKLCKFLKFITRVKNFLTAIFRFLFF